MTRYPLECGWHTGSDSSTPDAPTPTPAVLTSADGPTRNQPDQRPLLHFAEATDRDADPVVHFKTIVPDGYGDRLSEPRELHDQKWEAQFHLSTPAPTDGHVVQKITRTFDGRTIQFWEAWPVRRGQPGALPGRYSTDAELRFIPGPLPESFKEKQPEAPEQPVSRIKPDFWTDGESGIRRKWSYEAP